MRINDGIHMILPACTLSDSFRTMRDMKSACAALHDLGARNYPRVKGEDPQPRSISSCLPLSGRSSPFSLRSLSPPPLPSSQIKSLERFSRARTPEKNRTRPDVRANPRGEAQPPPTDLGRPADSAQQGIENVHRGFPAANGPWISRASGIGLKPQMATGTLTARPSLPREEYRWMSR